MTVRILILAGKLSIFWRGNFGGKCSNCRSDPKAGNFHSKQNIMETTTTTTSTSTEATNHSVCLMRSWPCSVTFATAKWAWMSLVSVLLDLSFVSVPTKEKEKFLIENVWISHTATNTDQPLAATTAVVRKLSRLFSRNKTKQKSGNCFFAITGQQTNGSSRCILANQRTTIPGTRSN